MPRFQLSVSEDDAEVAYLKLPTHPGSVEGAVKKTVSLRDVLGSYSGPDVNLDFDASGVLVGIEILG
jgi:hypothetical protein